MFVVYLLESNKVSSCCSDDNLFLSHYSVLGLNSFYGFKYGVVPLCRLRPKWISSVGLGATKYLSKPHHHTKVAASFMPQARILHVARFICTVFGLGLLSLNQAPGGNDAD